METNTNEQNWAQPKQKLKLHITVLSEEIILSDLSSLISTSVEEDVLVSFLAKLKGSELSFCISPLANYPKLLSALQDDTGRENLPPDDYYIVLEENGALRGFWRNYGGNRYEEKL